MKKNREIIHEQNRIRKKGKQSFYGISLLRPDGTPVACLNNAAPLLNEEGNMIGSFGMLTDITERNQMEKETNRLLAETQQRNAELAMVNHLVQELTGELDFQKMIDLASETLTDLLKAHKALDREVDLAYTRKRFSGDSDRITFLFDKYRQVSRPLGL